MDAISSQQLHEPKPRAFEPASGDVRAARIMLASRGLAIELVLQILEYARYWAVQITESNERLDVFNNDQNTEFSAVEPYLWVPLRLSAHPDGEVPKIREIEFHIAACDQGWTTEGTDGTYDTSSWFEVSHCRPRPNQPSIDSRGETYANIEQARREYAYVVEMLPRPSEGMEPHRMHCPEMKKVSWPGNYGGSKPVLDEGTHAWWLQGNLVAKSTSIFEEDHGVVWGCAANPRWEGNEGTGRGEGFVDGLKEGDRIIVWARAKRRGWVNHVFGVRVIIRYTI